jgi:SGNH hydrolase-like domain, acetyltransferase AlgX/Tetratricopeptide repeat
MADGGDADTALLRSAVPLVRGRSGRLFLHDYAGGAPRNSLSPDQPIYCMRKTLETRARQLRKRGIPYYILIGSEAHVIYRDELPEGYDLQKQSAASFFETAFGDIDNIFIINPEKILIQSKGGIDVYKANDSHWSAYGAYRAYLALMQQILPAYSVRRLKPSDVSFKFVRTFGDLGAASDPEFPLETPVAVINGFHCREVFQLWGEGRNHWHRFACDGPEAKLFLSRDSFATELAPFLMASFGRVDFVGATSRLHLEAIDQEKPDIVLWEVAERRLGFSLFDHARQTAYEIYAFDAAAPAGRLANQAYLLRESGKHEAALNQAKSALAEEGAGPANSYLVADILYEGGQLEEAEIFLRQAIAQRDDRPAYWHLLNMLCRAQGRLEEALDASAKAASFGLANAAFVTDYGYNLSESGQVDRAIEVLAGLSETVSDHGPLHFWLAVAYVRAGDLKAAQREAKRFSLLHPGISQTRELFGICQMTPQS